MLIVLLLIQCATLPDRPLPPADLKCEYRSNPLGTDAQTPRLSWEVNDPRRGAVQSAFQIQVAGLQALLEGEQDLIWDSGKISDDENINEAYAGPPLESGRRYYWRVRTWDANDQPSAYSEAAWWETALLGAGEWQAQWISDGKTPPEKDEDHYLPDPVPLFRKSFSLSRPIAKARLYVSGLGYYEGYLNGQKIGDHVLDPGWTQYGKQVLYSTYDVGDQLSQGENVIGFMLGNGWYNPLPMRLFGRWNLREILTIGRPKVLAQLHIRYEDGAEEIIATDESWKTSEGPILTHNVYLGETYDARRELPGWYATGFDDSGWKAAQIATAPPGALKTQDQPPIRITRSIRPVAITEPTPGVYVVDMGQNFAGWIRMKASGPAGTRLALRYGELLFDDGRVNGLTTVACQIKEMWNLSGGPGAPKTAWQEDTFILSGRGEDHFQHHFTFHGFRYIEITGHPGTPGLDDIEGLRLNSDLPQAGTFASSDSLLNRIQEMVEWTLLSNVFSVESDCPAREKFGYGGDMVTAGETYIFNYDMATFYRKAVQDFANDVRPNGGMPECAPHIGIDTEGFGEETGPVGWQLAYPYLQKLLYQFYGDRQLIEEHYPLTRGMVEFLRSQAKDHFIEHGISDHASIAPKPIALTSTAFYYHHVKLLAEFAEILGKSDDAAAYAQLADDIREAFTGRFLAPGTGRFDSATQAAQAFAIWYKFVPETEKSKALDVLVNDILTENKGHLNTGIFATKMLFDILPEVGRNDVAYTLASQQDFPGYGWMLENGATTLWESWKGETNAPSHNHPMFGAVSEWFYRALLGINPAPDAVGFDKILIRPQPPAQMQWAKGSYQSLRGEIRSGWEKTGDTFTLRLRIPANTSATVVLPVSDPKNVEIREGKTLLFQQGQPQDAQGIRYAGSENGAVRFQTGGGEYVFVVKAGG